MPDTTSHSEMTFSSDSNRANSPSARLDSARLADEAGKQTTDFNKPVTRHPEIKNQKSTTHSSLSDPALPSESMTAVWSHPERPKPIRAIVAVILGIILFLALVIFFYKPRVSFSPETQNTLITIDNQRFAGTSTRLSPGEHEISLTKTGYVPYIFKGKLNPFQFKNITITLRPLPQSKSLVTENAFAASFSPNGREFYYIGNNGKTLYKATIRQSKDGSKKIEKVAITPDILPALTQVLFSPDFFLAVFKKENGETGLYDFKRYDLLNQEYTTWGQDIGAVTWSPTGDKIAYYYSPHDGERAIIVSDRSHSNITRLFDVRDIGIDVDWKNPLAPQLAWSRDGLLLSVITNGNLYLLDVASQTLTPLAEGGITSAQFSPDNQSIVYTQNNNLVYQKAYRVNALSGNPEDAQNAGKIKAEPAQVINTQAVAAKGVFDIAGKKFIILTPEGIRYVALDTLTVKPFYLKEPVLNVTDLGLSDDGTNLYVLAGRQLLAVPLDAGSYGE